MKRFTYSNRKDYPTFVSSLEKFLSCNFFDEVIIVADDFMQGVVRDMQIISKKLEIIKYSDDIIEQL
jgi:2-C-methyl-D-erythritol 4-phosphate cytidylyltransferase